jgi:hypothetical protein
VRIESADGDYREADQPSIELYNDYFSGGMSGIVFQELRESRALAYSVGAAYLPASRIGEQNYAIGSIGCQADKTSEALAAFLGLFDELPSSAERFDETRGSLLNSYRTGKLGFRAVLPSVIGWEKVGLMTDPRRSRFEAIQTASLENVVGFQRERIRGRSRLISIIGDANRFNRAELEKMGEVREVAVGELFSY